MLRVIFPKIVPEDKLVSFIKICTNLDTENITIQTICTFSDPEIL